MLGVYRITRYRLTIAHLPILLQVHNVTAEVCIVSSDIIRIKPTSERINQHAYTASPF
jgi:hypothetical protein